MPRARPEALERRLERRRVQRLEARREVLEAFIRGFREGIRGRSAMAETLSHLFTSLTLSLLMRRVGVVQVRSNATVGLTHQVGVRARGMHPVRSLTPEQRQVLADAMKRAVEAGSADPLLQSGLPQAIIDWYVLSATPSECQGSHFALRLDPFSLQALQGTGVSLTFRRNAPVEALRDDEFTRKGVPQVPFLGLLAGRKRTGDTWVGNTVMGESEALDKNDRVAYAFDWEEKAYGTHPVFAVVTRESRGLRELSVVVGRPEAWTAIKPCTVWAVRIARRTRRYRGTVHNLEAWAQYWARNRVRRQFSPGDRRSVNPWRDVELDVSL